jgi:hypothetical protein
MTSLFHICNGDFRNEGWGLVGTAVSRLFHCWDNDDDNKYCYNPPHKGRACVRFPVNIGTVPEGAVITSVTIKIRAARIGSTPRTITVNVLPDDDTSRFTSRTIPLTTTPTDYEVATYQRDPLGNPWDIHRLNKILCQVFTYHAVLHCIRVYKVFVVINYRVRPTVAVDSPSGTQLTPSPVISWTYNQADGDLQSSAEYKIFTGTQVSDSTFNPSTTDPVYKATVTGDTTSVTLPTSLNADTYHAYVRVVSAFGARSVWVGREFSVQGPTPGIPVEDNTVFGGPGTGTVAVVPDSFRSAVALTLRNTSNLLSVQQADFETTTDGLEYVGTNCTPVMDTSVYYGGVASMKLTALSAATMTAKSTRVRCAPETPVTARAQFRAAATGRATAVRVTFEDDTFTALAGTVSASGTDVTSTWQETVVTGTSPAATKWARVEVDVVSPANAEVHNVDHVGLMYGVNTPWNDGGHASRNILDSFSSTAEDPTGVNWVAGVGSSISRVTPPGIGGHGLQTKRLTYNGITPSLAFRATGANFNSTSSGTNYTLNAPAGIAVGDLMLAFVTSSVSGTCTPPAGWTLVNSAVVDDGSTDTALFVLKRTATGSEPGSWTDGALSVASTRRHARVVAYSGAADASQQFISENVITSASDTPTYITSAVVNNTDVNAWRVAAFAFNDDVSGTIVANTQPPAASPAISYVGKGTVWSTASNTTGYTINRPSGVQNGDLMIATVSVSDPVVPTVTAPAGWTVVRNITESDSFAALKFVVLKRTAGSSEPASWSGTFGSTVKPVMTQVVAYRGADTAANQFVAENTSQSGSGSSVTTATVTNTDSRSWRVSVFAASNDYDTYWNWTNETTERADNSEEYWASWSSYRTVTVAVADSNGTIGTGSTNRSATLNRSYFAAASWVGIIKALPSPPAPGANETERVDDTTGASNPFMAVGVYDSNGVVPTGAQSVTGAYTPSSGSSMQSAASWIGLIKPAVPLTSGLTVATAPDVVDISHIDPAILARAGNQVTYMSDFIGSTAGTPFLTLHFYRANQLISSQTFQGTSFGTSLWISSLGKTEIPEGTTGIKPEVSVTDRTVGDFVYFDRIAVMLGDTPVWRNGTGRSTHPVWSAPWIQYADDDGSGYGDWQDLPGQTIQPPEFDPLTGITQYVDNTVIPLQNRKYRAQTISYGLAGDKFVSGYGPDSDEVSLTAREWWLKDLTTDFAMILRVHVPAGPVTVGTTNTAVAFQPLGEDYPVVLTEGYKGDAFELTLVLNREEHAQLRAQLRTGRTLFLQSPVDHAWWVRPVGDLSAAIQYTGQRFTNPIRFFKITFVQVKPEG